MRSPIPARWVAITVFIFASVLNYLDRQILATMVDIWRTRPEFPFTYDDYGLLLSVFSIAYALSALFVGWFIDRVGLNRGTGFAVAVWAVASFGTGASHSVHELLVWRALLGISEASAIAAVTKAVAMYLLPPERAVGQAMSQLGLSLGAGIAPAFAVYFSYRYSWHWAFYAAGLLSLAWIPMWLATARAIPPVAPPPTAQGGAFVRPAARSEAVGADDRQHARHDGLQPVGELGAHLPGARPSSDAAPSLALHLDRALSRLLRRIARRRHLLAIGPLRPHAGRRAQACLPDFRRFSAGNHGRAAAAQPGARHRRECRSAFSGCAPGAPIITRCPSTSTAPDARLSAAQRWCSRMG